MLPVLHFCFKPLACLGNRGRGDATPSTSAVDIAADYTAKHGAPSAAAPKIFFRYYLVNGATGEKSGTMLAECKWTAGE